MDGQGIAPAHVAPKLLGRLIPAPQVKRGTIQVHKAGQQYMPHSACPLRRIEVPDVPNRADLVRFIPFLEPICHSAFQLPLDGKYHKFARIMVLFEGLFEQDGLKGMKAAEAAYPL